MASSETFDVILRLLMDEAALGRIKSGASSVAKEFEKVDNKTEEVTKEIQRQEKIAISAMKKEAAAINRLASLRSKEIKELKERAQWIEKGSKAMFAVGVAGITSITLLAKKYIDSTEESNEITKAWAASTQKVSDAQMRIGKIAAEAVLPIYEKLANLAGKTADFVEKHPGVLEAGLKASIVAAGLGGIGLLVSKGITLYADIKMIAVGDMQLVAAKLMSDAANKQLAAATGGKVNPFLKGAGGAVGAGGTVAAGAGTAAGGAAAITLGQAAGIATAGAVIGTGLAIEIDIIIKKFAELTGMSKSSEMALSLLARTVGTVTSPVYALGVSITNLSKILGFDMTEATLSALGATQENTQAKIQETQATTNAARSSLQLAGASNATSQNLARVPAALSSVGNSISSFLSNLFSFGSRNRPPVHDYTGYAYSQVYKMADNGQRQFVMSGSMTKLAEQMLGGQLNQQKVLSAMTGNSSRQVTFNGRFSGEYSKGMKREIENNVLGRMSEAIRK